MTKSSNTRPLQAAKLLAGAFFLSKIIGFVQLTLIKALLPGGDADAYVAAFILPDIVNYLVAGGALSVTFIPIFNGLQQDGDERGAWRFFSTVATLMGLALLVFVTLGVIFTPQLVAITAPGLTEPDKKATFDLTVAMTRVVLPSQLFFYLGGMFVGVLNAFKRFAASGFTSVLNNVIAIGAGVGLWWLSGGSPMGFAWGILLGALGGNFVLPFLALKSGPKEHRLQFGLSFDYKQPAVKKFFINTVPIMIGVSLPVVDQIVVRFFSSEFSEGAMSNLAMGNRFMVAPLAVVAQAASVAAFPYLASDSHAQNWPKFAEFLRTGLRRLMFLTLPMSMLLILISQPLLRLFEFGQLNRFSADQIAVAFAFYCVGLFAWAGQQFIARGFYALQDTRTPTIIGSLLTFFFFLPLTWFMARWGILGLALATSIGAGAHFVAITCFLSNRLRRYPYRAPLRLIAIVGTMLRTGTACAIMAIVGLSANRLALWALGDNTGKGSELVRIIFVTVLALWAFGNAATQFNIPEWFWLRQKFLRRKGT